MQQIPIANQLTEFINMSAGVAVPLFVSHLTRISKDRSHVLDFRRNFFIIRHKHDRRRFRKSAVKQALEHLICYLGTVQTEKFPTIESFESDSDTDIEFDEDLAATLAAEQSELEDAPGSDEDFDESLLSDEDRITRKLESIRQEIYQLGPYLAADLKSWRVQLLLAPIELNEFCNSLNLPVDAIRKWIKTPIVDESELGCTAIAFGWVDSHHRYDPFWMVFRDSKPMLLRSAQRFLTDFSDAHRAFLDTLAELKVGDGADDRTEDEEVAIDEDAFVDAKHEMRRAKAAQWCQDELLKWNKRHQRHLHNPLQLEGYYQQQKTSITSQKKVEREKYIEHLGKKLQHKKGKGKAVKSKKHDDGFDSDE